MNVFVDLCIVFSHYKYIREYYIVYTPKNVKKIALISEPRCRYIILFGKVLAYIMLIICNY